jgi:hypothetical protein
MYTLRFRGQYPEPIAQELDAMLAEDSAWKTLEHSDEGAHNSESTGAALLDIGQNTISYAQMQNVSAASRVLGRGSSGAGDPQELALDDSLQIFGTTLGVAGFASDTWTPIDGSGAGLAFTSVEANYVRLGPLVVATGTLTYPATGSASNAVIGGLPVTSATTVRTQASGVVANTKTLTLAYRVTPNATTCALVNSTTLAAVTNSALSGGTVSFTVIYLA